MRFWTCFGLIASAVPLADAGRCSTARQCSRLSEQSCRDAYDCVTYDAGSSIQGSYGNVDTITSFVSKKCTDSSSRSCESDFESESSCNARSGCMWVEDVENNAPSPPSGPVCDSVRIASGCEDTYMGAITGMYRPTGASCAGRQVYENEDGSRTMIHDDDKDYWKVGYLCNGSSCRCLPPSYATFTFDDERVSCYDGRSGYGSSSSKEYESTDLLVECIASGGGGGGSDEKGQAGSVIGVYAENSPVDISVQPEDGPGSGEPPVAVRAGTSRREFCKDMGGLEEHLTNKFEDQMGSIYAADYECFCSARPGVDIQINCSLQYSESGQTYSNEEKIKFRFDEGSGNYHLSETSWLDTIFESLSPQEVFSFDKRGALASCEADACSPCTVCDDKKSIEVDCNSEFGYAHECSDYYAGSFANTFDFGTIYEEGTVGSAASGGAAGDFEDGSSPAEPHCIGAAAVGLAVVVSSFFLI